jgi:hypothetical protein
MSWFSSAPYVERGVDPVSGRVVEDADIRAAGLAELRRQLAALRDGGGAAASEARLPREDDKFLLAFLRAKKYDVPKALKCLVSFGRFWYSHPEIVEGLCAARVKDVWRLGMMGFLPSTRDVHGNTVTVLRMGAIDFGAPEFKAHYTARNMLSLSLYILLQMFEDEEMQLHGACYVETLEGFTFANAMKLSGTMNSKDQQEVMAAGTDTFPLRIRDIYVIHQPWYFSIFWAIVKPFLKAKLTKRLHLLGDDVAALHKVVDPKGLPADFGGALPYDLSGFLDAMEKQELARGEIGGFVVPMSLEDPTGAKRKATAAAAVAAPETVDVGVER